MEVDLSWIQILIAAGLVIIMILVGIRYGAHSTEEEYLVGGRAIGAGFFAATTAAGIIGGGVLLIFSEYTFRYGLSALSIVAGIVVGTLVTLPVALKFKPLADKQRFYTFPDLFAYAWGRDAGMLATIVIGLWTIGFVVVQLISAGTVLEVMTGWPYWVGVIVAAGVVASYLISSGFKAVVITDVMQYGALILLLGVTLFAVLQRDALAVSFRAIGPSRLDWGTSAGFFILGMLNMIVSADLWQRVYAARDVATAERGLKLTAILVLLAALLLLVPPFYARAFLPSVPPNMALVRSIELLLPSWLLGFALVGVLATVIATLDTMVFILGISIAHDLQVRQFNQPAQRRVRSTRAAMALTLLIGSVVAIIWPQLMTVALALSTLGLVLAPSIIWYRFSDRVPSRAVVFGLSFGLVSFLVLLIGNFFKPGLLTPETSVIALVAAILGTIIGAVVRERFGDASDV